MHKTDKGSDRAAGEPLRGAVVGFGRMGLTHFAILNTHPDVQFVGICDSSSFMRKNVGRYVGVETFDDYVKMIDTTRPDFVIVATPTAGHAEITRYALEKGAHVFVEKPFTLSPAEGAGVMEALAATPKINQVGYVVRYNDVMMRVRSLLAAGALGELVHFKFSMNGPTVLRQPRSWRAKKSQGGGCLYDFASHTIDLVNFLFGEPRAVTGTVMQKIYSRDVEDAVYSNFLYDGGLRGSLLVNWSDPSYRKPTYGIEILGKEGKIIADLHAYKIFFKGEALVEGYNRGWNTRYVTDFVEPVRMYLRGYEFTRQLDEFVARIRGADNECLCTFADGLATDRIIDRIVADAATGEAANG